MHDKFIRSTHGWISYLSEFRVHTVPRKAGNTCQRRFCGKLNTPTACLHFLITCLARNTVVASVLKDHMPVERMAQSFSRRLAMRPRPRRQLNLWLGSPGESQPLFGAERILNDIRIGPKVVALLCSLLYHCFVTSFVHGYRISSYVNTIQH